MRENQGRNSRSGWLFHSSPWIVPLFLGLTFAGSCGEQAGPPTQPAHQDGVTAAADVGTNALPTEKYDSDADGLYDEQEEILLRQYRPFWDFDNQESIFPITLEEWAAVGGYIGSTSNSYTSVSSLNVATLNNSTSRMTNTNGLYFGKHICNGNNAAGDPGFDPSCNDAPTFVDAVPTIGSVFGIDSLVWLHYFLLFQWDTKDGPFNINAGHYGEWEHICVLTSLSHMGQKSIQPIALHFHYHGRALGTSSVYAYHSDRNCVYGLNTFGCYGTRHPRVYVEAWGHGMYRGPGDGIAGPHDGGYRFNDDQLNNPMIFMTSHRSNAGYAGDDIIRRFRGRWGRSTVPASPFGPLIYNTFCDHDYLASPTYGDWDLVRGQCPT